MKHSDKLSAIQYLRAIYDGEVYLRNGEYHILFKNARFKIKPSASKRNFSFCLYENGEYKCKFVDSNFIRGLFVIWNYPNYRETGIEPSVEDWLSFISNIKNFRKAQNE